MLPKGTTGTVQTGLLEGSSLLTQRQAKALAALREIQ